jgi:ubiquinol-cytochrome c reductase iron-sulfur subunit
MTDTPQPPRRRDLLTTTAIALTAAGGAIALWPLLSATTPDEESLARRRLFALSTLGEAGETIAEIDGKPVLVFRRTDADLQALPSPATPATAGANWRQSPFRSRRPDIMVCIASCTYDGAIVKRSNPPDNSSLRCILCNSQFDLAGRRTSGIAARDLDVPDYRFLSSGEIEFAAL